MWKTGGEVRKYEMSDRHDDSTYFMVDILKTDLSIHNPPQNWIYIPHLRYVKLKKAAKNGRFWKNVFEIST